MAHSKKALGRLIDSIIPKEEEGPEIFMCPVDEIIPNPNQPRKRFREESLKALADSIKSSGVLQPICVRKIDDGYQIVFGERRWRAAAMAGLERIPATVLEGNDKDILKLSVAENILREDLSPIETAEAFRLLSSELGLSHSEIGELFGIDRSTVTNTIRLLSLPQAIKDMLEDGTITPGHARALLPLGDETLMVKYAQMVAEKGLSVRELERLIKGRKKETKKREDPPLEERELQAIKRVEDALGVKVKIKGKPERPKLEIALKDRESLVRLLGLLGGIV